MLVCESLNMKILFVLFILLYSNINFASKGPITGLDLPRFVSLKSDDSNVRVGPSKNYPILRKYIVKNYPLKIIEEYDDWRKIIDFQNNTGWVHKSIIKGERYGIIISEKKNNINIHNTSKGKIIGQVTINSIVSVPKCKLSWCFVSINNQGGWVEKKNIWGIKSDEKYNITYLQIFLDYYIRSINYISTNF